MWIISTKTNVEKGIFHPQAPIDSILVFMGNCMDGIAQGVAAGAMEGTDDSSDVSMMVELLAKAVIGFLEV